MELLTANPRGVSNGKDIQNGYRTATKQTSANACHDVVEAAVAAPAGVGYGSKVVATYDGLMNRTLFNGTGRDMAGKGTVDFSVTAAEAGLMGASRRRRG